MRWGKSPANEALLLQLCLLRSSLLGRVGHLGTEWMQLPSKTPGTYRRPHCWHLCQIRYERLRAGEEMVTGKGWLWAHFLLLLRVKPLSSTYLGHLQATSWLNSPLLLWLVYLLFLSYLYPIPLPTCHFSSRVPKWASRMLVLDSDCTLKSSKSFQSDTYIWA